MGCAQSIDSVPAESSALTTINVILVDSSNVSTADSHRQPEEESTVRHSTINVPGHRSLGQELPLKNLRCPVSHIARPHFSREPREQRVRLTDGHNTRSWSAAAVDDGQNGHAYPSVEMEPRAIKSGESDPVDGEHRRSQLRAMYADYQRGLREHYHAVRNARSHTLRTRDGDRQKMVTNTDSSASTRPSRLRTDSHSPSSQHRRQRPRGVWKTPLLPEAAKSVDDLIESLFSQPITFHANPVTFETYPARPASATAPLSSR